MGKAFGARNRKFNRLHLIWIIPLAMILMMAAAFLLYAGSYYRADRDALDALVPDGQVSVSETDYGWHFDGPSEDSALIFYPGAKVEAEAYAPLLRDLAGAGMDACLVRMPLRFAILGIDKADAVMKRHDYPRWFIGGHSLGGAMAARYAAGHPDGLEGVILLAAYADRPLGDAMTELVVYGSEDKVLSPSGIEKGRAIAPEHYIEHVIPGGNHAQFGSYGIQSGDGDAAISREAQQAETINVILETISDPAH